MSDSQPAGLSRRDVLKTTGQVAAASLLTGLATTPVHAAEDNTIQLAIIGCGGRGSGALKNSLRAPLAPIKLVAMADVFPDRLASSHKAATQHAAKMVDVPDDRKFIGVEAYKQAMDCLKPGDVVMLTTPPAFRWVHYAYAIEKGLNVFMEKPAAVDGPSARKMLALNEEAKKKNLKVGVGLMCRHCNARKELFDRIQGGEIGDIVAMRAYRMSGNAAHAFVEKKPESEDELLYQIKSFHAFLWLSGGAFSDFYIHNIDECCWMKNAWPVEAKAIGGRHYRADNVDQNFDSYAVEYTFPDGAKLFLDGHIVPGCYEEFASYAHGTKGSAVISSSSHTPAKCKIYKSQLMTRQNQTWRYPPPETNPYDLEWDSLIEAIRKDQPYNEVQRGVEASVVTAMGRYAAHTGQKITFEEMLNHSQEMGADIDKLKDGSAPPLVADKDGKYPVPRPGIITNREY